MSAPVLASIEAPVQQPPSSRKEPSPAQLQHWIEALPYGSMPELAQNLVDKLSRMNRRQQPYGQRLAKMKLFEVPAGKVRQAYLHSDAQVSHFEEKYQVLPMLSRKLNKELAYGYKAVIIDCLNEGKRWGQDKVLANAIFRALTHIGHTMLDRFVRYECCAPHAWREVNALYALAQARRLQHTSLPHPLEEKHVATVEQRYKRLMLLNLIDPFHLPYGEITLIYQYLRVHTELAEVSQAPLASSPQAGEFLLDLEGSQPARHRLPDDFEFHGGQHRVLRTHSGLLDQVQADLKRFERGQMPTALTDLDQGHSLNTEKMLQHMQHAWSSPPLRDLPRHEDLGPVKVIYGLQALYNFFHQDITEKDMRRTCQRLDSGPQGMGLSIPLPTQPFISVGELFAVELLDPELGPHWVIATVRWLQRAKKSAIKAGIQYLGYHPQPALIHPLSLEGKPGQGQAALLMKNQAGQANGELFGSTQLFKPGRRFMLTVGKESTPILAESLRESTSGFDLFCYSTE